MTWNAWLQGFKDYISNNFTSSETLELTDKLLSFKSNAGANKYDRIVTVQQLANFITSAGITITDGQFVIGSGTGVEGTAILSIVDGKIVLSTSGSIEDGSTNLVDGNAIYIYVGELSTEIYNYIANTVYTHISDSIDALSSVYVPYTGASANVDLGDYTIDIKRILQSNNGGSIFIGEGAGLNDDLSNNLNVFIGKQSGYTNIQGLYNTAIGAYSHYYNIEGMSNVAIGYFSLLKSTKNDNVAIGVNSIKNSIDGFRNTVIGSNALEFFTDGNNNTAIGFNAGNELITGIGNVLIGSETNLKNNSSNDTNEIVIGANAIGNGSNTATIGDDNITDFYAGEDGQAKVHCTDILNKGTSFFGDITYLEDSVGDSKFKFASKTNPLATKEQYNVFGLSYIQEGGAALKYSAGRFVLDIDPTSTTNYTDSLAALLGTLDHDGSGTLSWAYGLRASIRNWESGGITEARAIEAIVNNNGSGTIANARGLFIPTPVVTGPITNSYGIYINAHNVASGNNYAIYTNEGKVRFGDEMTSTSAKIGNVAGGNYLEIDANGQVRLYGIATQYDDLRVSAVSTKLGGSKDPNFAVVRTNGTGSQGVFTYMFDDSIEQELYFAVQLPHTWKQGSNIEAHVHWLPMSNGAAGTDVSWGLEYSWANIGDVLPNTTIIYGDTNHLEETLVQYKHYITELGSIDATDKTFSSMLLCRVFRDATGGGGTDDYTGDAALLEIDFHYQIDSLGSNEEYIKY